jgi:hypothetical protein
MCAATHNKGIVIEILRQIFLKPTVLGISAEGGYWISKAHIFASAMLMAFRTSDCLRQLFGALSRRHDPNSRKSKVDDSESEEREGKIVFK